MGRELIDLREAILKRKAYEAQFAQQQILFKGTIQVGPNGSSSVPNTPDHNWVQPNGVGELVAVYNRKMKGNLINAGVVVGFEAYSTTLEILRSDESTIAGIVPTPGLDIPNHWESHLIDGADAVPIHPNAMFILLTYTLGLTGLVVSVSPYVYQLDDGTITYFPGQANFDLSSHAPATGLARYVLIYLDLATNDLLTLAGATTVDSPSFVPVPPTVPDNAVPSALVRIAGDQTVIGHRDIVPVQDYLFGASRIQPVLDTLETQMLDLLAAQENEFDLALTLHAVNGF